MSQRRRGMRILRYVTTQWHTIKARTVCQRFLIQFKSGNLSYLISSAMKSLKANSAICSVSNDEDNGAICALGDTAGNTFLGA